MIEVLSNKDVQQSIERLNTSNPIRKTDHQDISNLEIIFIHVYPFVDSCIFTQRKESNISLAGHTNCDLPSLELGHGGESTGLDLNNYQ